MKRQELIRKKLIYFSKIKVAQHIRKVAGKTIRVKSFQKAAMPKKKLSLSKARNIKNKIKEINSVQDGLERGFAVNKAGNTSKTSIGEYREVEIKGIGSTKNVFGSAHNHPQDFAPPSTQDLGLFAKQNQSKNYIASKDGTIFRVSPGGSLGKNETQRLIRGINGRTGYNPLINADSTEEQLQHATNLGQHEIMKLLNKYGVIKYRVKPTEQFKSYLAKSAKDVEKLKTSGFLKDIEDNIKDSIQYQRKDSLDRLKAKYRSKKKDLDNDLFEDWF